MASWSAYFSACVKNKDERSLPATPDANEGKPLPAKPNVPNLDTKTTKPPVNKLYGSPVDLGINPTIPRRSDSNAARVAKLFGYANSNLSPEPAAAPTPALASIADVAREAARAAKKSEAENLEDTPKPLSFFRKSIQADTLANSQEEEEPLATKPLDTKPLYVKPSDVKPLVVKPSVAATSAPRPPRTRKSTKPSISGLDALLEELGAGDSNTNPAQLTHSTPPAQPAPAVQERAPRPRVKKGSLSDLDKLMIELGGGANIIQPITVVAGKPKPATSRQGSLDALMDDLASFGPMTTPTPTPASVTRSMTASTPAPGLIPMSKSGPDSTAATTQPAHDDVFFSPRNMTSSPEPILTMNDSPSMKQDFTLSPISIRSRQDLFASRSSVSSRRKDSLTSPSSSISRISDLSFSSRRRDSPISRNSSISRTSDLSSIIEPVLSEEDQLRLRQRVLESEKQEEQLRTEKEKRALEHEQMLEYERQAERIIMEREVMEEQRRQMLKDEARFNEEAKRLEEEEEQMRIFLQDVERERQKEEEEERMRIQAIDKAERLRKEKEERFLEGERFEQDKNERRRIEKDRRRREEEDMREEEEQRRGRQGRQRARQLEDDREREEGKLREERRLKQAEKKQRANEEAERAAAQAKEYEREIEAERLRFELEDAEFEEQRKWEEEGEAMRWQQAEEERRRLEEEVEKREAQRARDERIAIQKRAAKERAERERARAQQQMQFEDEDSGPEGLTKEQEMKKAEEKIRAAFAGMAKEKEAAANGSLEPPRVARNNTMATRPSALRQALGISRGNTTAGLPSGPRVGGLQRGPRRI